MKEASKQKRTTKKHPVRKNKENSGHNVQKQILRVFLFDAVIPILAVGLFAIISMRRELRSRYQSQIDAESLRVRSLLFQLTTAVYTGSESVFGESISMELFSGAGDDVQNERNASIIEDDISGMLDSNAAISAIRIYTNNPNVPEGSVIEFLSAPDALKAEWYTMIGGRRSAWRYLARLNWQGEEIRELALIRRLAVPSGHYWAYEILWIDGNYLRNILNTTVYTITCTDSSGQAYFSNRDDTNGPSDADNIPASDISVLHAETVLTPYKTEDPMTIRIDDPDAASYLRRMTLLYLILIVTAVLVPFVLILWFSRRFSRRVRALRSSMHQARLGNYEITEEVRGDDELSETFDDLKATIDKVREQEEEYYNLKIRQQEMEYKMLANQINPHFLFNTLEMIRMQALAGGNRDVSNSIKLLSKSIHYVLENTGTGSTTLAKELDYVETYLKIQKLRFGDRVGYDISVQEGLVPDEIRLMPLLLQPIVENAVVHGLESVKTGGEIRIRIACDPDHAEDLLFTVSDNGGGMDPEKLNALRKNINEHDPSSTSSIGLYNINRRVHLLYGEEYGLTVDSQEGIGTTVTLRIGLQSGRDR